MIRGVRNGRFCWYRRDEPYEEFVSAGRVWKSRLKEDGEEQIRERLSMAPAKNSLLSFAPKRKEPLPSSERRYPVRSRPET